jgi:hypothetical protein
MANRKISRPIMVIVAAIVIVLAGLGFAGYFIYEGSFYYQTDNAKGEYDYLPAYRKRKWSIDKNERISRRRGKSGTGACTGRKWPIRPVPIDGTVADVRMQKGDYVIASARILIIAKTSDTNITANVEETNILKIQGRAYQSHWMHTAGVLMLYGGSQSGKVRALI